MHCIVSKVDVQLTVLVVDSSRRAKRGGSSAFRAESTLGKGPLTG